MVSRDPTPTKDPEVVIPLTLEFPAILESPVILILPVPIISCPFKSRLAESCGVSSNANATLAIPTVSNATNSTTSFTIVPSISSTVPPSRAIYSVVSSLAPLRYTSIYLAFS